jgi:hypothetical protein
MACLECQWLGVDISLTVTYEKYSGQERAVCGIKSVKWYFRFSFTCDIQEFPEER